MTRFRLFGTVLLGFLTLTATRVFAEEAPQSLDDAWWTGSLVSYSAHSLPKGHLLIEPYLFDVSAGDTDSVHSFTYFLYGATDRLTLGVASDFAFNRVRNAPDSTGVHPGDTTLRAQYMLSAMDPARYVPDLALAVLQTLPTGKYERLDRSSDGFGAGAYATTLAVYSQWAWWMPNGRLLRTRLNVAETFSSRVPVAGASVYGTEAGFLGHAMPGNQLSVSGALEYSLTRNWVLAMDLIYNHGNATFVQGAGVSRRVGGSDAYGFAPAIEYNWSGSLGIIAGVRIFPQSHNSPLSVTPAIAINYVD